MKKSNLFVSELSTSHHEFHNYHFCRGNSNKRKTRIGIILRGHGSYIYLNQKLDVSEGDVVFIPENIYCYSEWHGSPEIEVLYLCCFLHYESFRYEPQRIAVEEQTKESILQISRLLGDGGQTAELEAYSLFYRLLQVLLPQMATSDLTTDKTLQNALAFVTSHWNEEFSVADLAKKCCVSESTIYHLFQRELGQSPVHVLHSIRINMAIEYLENTDCSISTISHMVGFRSENHFRKVFTEITGTTPLKLRKNK